MRRHSLVSFPLTAALLLGAMLLPQDAQAQFTNNTIGFQAGYLVLEDKIGADSGPILGIEGTLYLDAGFDLFFRAAAGVHKARISKNTAIGFFPSLGVRYHLSDEDFRPYLGGSFAYMDFYGVDELGGTRFSVSPFAGVEYYFSSNAAAGLQGEYHRIIALNADGGNAFAIVARILWGF